jgi:Xaa-Pro aminopeptidase
VTRTVVIGVVGDEVKDRFTRVLKGHINLARARFPQGTVGAQLDTFAREALWEVGLDYAHGTGHGVGCYLSVHEEAASISPRGADPVRVGMILSNEPGYYEEGAYGIRHENLLLCHESGALSSDGRNLLHFETLTLVPFDRRGITVSLLRLEEREWLNAYHARVRETLIPYLDEAEQAWLIAATRPV